MSIRVLIVDDSKVVREIVKRILHDTGGFEVVGEAENGLDGVRLCLEKKPDVVIMDLRMPVMDGLEAIKRIMEERPTPILVLTVAVDEDEYYTSFEALSRGAVDIVKKPRGSWDKLAKELPLKLRIISKVEVKRRKNKKVVEVIGIGSSTGGPVLGRKIIETRPSDYPVPVLVVQHLSEGFEEGFVTWLRSSSSIPVRLASEGMEVEKGVTIAVPGKDMVVEGRKIRLPPGVEGAPSIDRFFSSLAEEYGEGACGILLSGMGEDGAEGLLKIRLSGGRTYALREEECAVYGISRAALEKGAVNRTSSLFEIVEAINEFG